MKEKQGDVTFQQQRISQIMQTSNDENDGEAAGIAGGNKCSLPTHPGRLVGGWLK